MRLLSRKISPPLHPLYFAADPEPFRASNAGQARIHCAGREVYPYGTAFHGAAAPDGGPPRGLPRPCPHHSRQPSSAPAAAPCCGQARSPETGISAGEAPHGTAAGQRCPVGGGYRRQAADARRAGPLSRTGAGSAGGRYRLCGGVLCCGPRLLGGGRHRRRADRCLYRGVRLGGGDGVAVAYVRRLHAGGAARRCGAAPAGTGLRLYCAGRGAAVLRLRPPHRPAGGRQPLSLRGWTSPRRRARWCPALPTGR